MERSNSATLSFYALSVRHDHKSDINKLITLFVATYNTLAGLSNLVIFRFKNAYYSAQSISREQAYTYHPTFIDSFDDCTELPQTLQNNNTKKTFKKRKSCSTSMG